MPQDPKNNPLLDEAIEWLVLLRSGRATPADHARFAEWQALSPEHAEAFRAAKGLWGILHLAREAEGPVSRHDGYRGAQPVLQRWRLAALATAALLLLAAGLHALHVTDRWLSDHYTCTGEQREVVLADGSRAFLNTDSALSIDYTESIRQVRLHRGQVLFTVAPEAVRPFEVIADDARVQALGTVFEVYKEPGGEIRVIVQEHAVRIRREVIRAIIAAGSPERDATVCRTPMLGFAARGDSDRSVGRSGRERPTG
ncbi:MAG: FecR family protein [Gammaproteobacteria bacterium]